MKHNFWINWFIQKLISTLVGDDDLAKYENVVPTNDKGIGKYEDACVVKDDDIN